MKKLKLLSPPSPPLSHFLVSKGGVFGKACAGKKENAVVFTWKLGLPQAWLHGEADGPAWLHGAPSLDALSLAAGHRSAPEPVEAAGWAKASPPSAVAMS